MPNVIRSLLPWLLVLFLTVQPIVAQSQEPTVQTLQAQIDVMLWIMRVQNWRIGQLERQIRTPGPYPERPRPIMVVYTATGYDFPLTSGPEFAIYLAKGHSGAIEVWEWDLDPEHPTHKLVYRRDEHGKEEKFYQESVRQDGEASGQRSQGSGTQ